MRAAGGLDEVLRARQARLVGLFNEFVSGTGWGALDASSLLNGFGQWLALNQVDGRWVATIAAAFREAGGGAVGATLPDSVIQAALVRNGVAGDRASVTFDDPVAWGAPPTSGYADDPVNVAAGNFVLVEDDLRSGGLAGLLRWTRTYNSRSDRAGPLGRGWSCVASARLVAVAGAAHWVAPDGQRATLPARDPAVGGSGGVVYERVPGVHGVVRSDGDGLALVTPDAAVWRFGADGLLAWVEHGPGTRVDAVHEAGDGGARLVALVHEGGRRLEVGWEGDRIASVSRSGGGVVRYRYDEVGDLVGVDAPSGPVRFEVDGRGRVVAGTDGDGVAAFRNTYDGEGRVVGQRSPFGRNTRYRYLPGGTAVVDDDAGGPVATYHHDDGGRLVGLVDDHGARLTKAYDGNGDVVAVVDRLGATTLFEWDEHRRLAARVLPTGAVLRFEHDDLGRVVSVAAPGDAVTRFAYDGAERVPSRVTDPEGGVTRLEVAGGLVSRLVDPDDVELGFAYDGDGQLTGITDGDGGVTTLERDAAGRLVGSVSPLGLRRVVELDGAGRPVATVDPAGGRTARAYSRAGRLRATVDPGGARRALARGPGGEVTEVIDPVGGVTRRVFDALGNLVRLSEPGGGKWELGHDGLGRLTSAVDPAGASWLYGYDAEGHLVETVDPEGVQRRAEIDPLGRIVGVSDGSVDPADPAGGPLSTARFAYDALGRVLSHQRADGSVLGAAYDRCGRRTTVVEPDGAVTRVAYTAGGRVASRTSPLGHRTTYRYDRCGRPSAETDPLGSRTRVRYDADSRVVEVESPTGEVERRAYDRAGRVTEVTAPGGRRSTVTYDPAGRPVAITDPAGGTRRFAYDPAGRMVEAVDANGGVTRYAYDPAGNLAAVTDPLGGRVTRTHDPVGRVVSEVDQLGRVTTLEWDQAGRLRARRDPDGRVCRSWRDEAGRVRAVGTDAPIVAWERDRLGRPVAATAPGAATTLAWDDAGRLTTKQQTAGPATLTLSRRHDADGRLVAVSGPDGTETTYTWDPAGRLAGFSHPAAGHVAYTRDGAGRLLTATGPGWTRRWTYTHGQLATTEVDLDGAAPRRTVLHRDAAGRVVAVDTPEGTTTYAYDPAGQLTATDGPSGSRTYSYDAAGRLTTETGPAGTTTYTHDAASQLTATDGPGGPCRYDHDGAGRRHTEHTPTGTRTFDWDPLGRLAAISHRSPDGTETRTTLDVDASGDLVAVDGTPLLWDTGGALSRLVHIGDTAIIGPDPTRATINPAGEATWLDTDWQTSTTTRTDPYGAGGTTTAPLPAGLDLGHRGEVTLDHLLWLRARVYDPTTRAFLTKDPIAGTPGAPTSANPYAYAGNDPIGHADPHGLHPLTDTELNAARDALSQNGFERAGHWLGDNWEYIAAAAMIVGGAAIMFTGVGGPIGAAMIGGALMGGGFSAGSQKLTTGGVDWKRVGVDAAIGGLAGGAGAWAGGASALTNIANPVLRGAAVGATESLVGGGVSRAAYGENPLDPRGMVQDTLLGGGFGAAGGRLAGREPPVGTTPRPAAAADDIANAADSLEGTRVYRVWGTNPDTPDLMGSQSGPWGGSWTRTDPGTVPKYRDVAGLPDDANMGRFVSEGVLRDPTGVTVTTATPIGANSGGLDELVIPNAADKIDLIGVFGVNPAF